MPRKYDNIFPAGMLMWFCQDTSVIRRICEGGESIQAMETSKDCAPDDVVDVDVNILEKFFTRDAWTIVLNAGREVQMLISISAHYCCKF